MKLYELLFSSIKRLAKILKLKIGPLSVSGVIFFLILLINAGLYEISNYAGLQQMEKASYLFLHILFMYMILLIPIGNNKLSKALRTTSHKSYFYFIFFGSILVLNIISEIIKIFPAINYQKVFIQNQINIIFTIYGILTILWFAYQLIYTNELSKLRKQLQLYIFIVTILQLFVVNKYSTFEYSISVLIITYTYIQYLFEIKSEKLIK